MEKLFISHLNNQNQIALSYATNSLPYIFAILILLFLFSIRKKGQRTKDVLVYRDNFIIETTLMLRGIAVIFLIFGHLAIKCIEGSLPFEYAARWAVIIFLFLSGIGLTKVYGLRGLEKKFLLKRIKRLVFPLWITLILFYLLNYFLLDWTRSPIKIIVSFLAILFPWPPNDPAWFITYIFYLYFLYYVVSLLRIRDVFKSLIILFLSYLTMYCIIHSQLINYFAIWIEYTAVFPVSVLVGLYRNKLFDYMKSAYKFSPVVFFITLSMSVVVFFYYDGTSNRSSSLLQSNPLWQLIKTIEPLILIVPLLMSAFLLDFLKYKPRLLLSLGEYSYEIYLLHMPFLVYYDFFLFRKPLVIFFFVYCLFIILLSYGLRIGSEFLNKKFFYDY